MGDTPELHSGGLKRAREGPQEREFMVPRVPPTPPAKRVRTQRKGGLLCLRTPVYSQGIGLLVDWGSGSGEKMLRGKQGILGQPGVLKKIKNTHSFLWLDSTLPGGPGCSLHRVYERSRQRGIPSWASPLRSVAQARGREGSIHTP